MKNPILKFAFITLFFISFFSACEKDTEDDKNNNSNINGTDSLAFTTAEKQRIQSIKSKYYNIQTDFAGTFFVTPPTATPIYTIGEVKAEVLNAGIDAINLMRFIAGIPYDVVLDAQYSNLCQHGAVLMTAVNTLTHYPPKPADMDQDFYDKGALAAKSSNIATVNTPYTSVLLYMGDSDASNIDRVGHRRWILNPPMKKSGFGVGLARYGLMYAFDKSRGSVDFDFVAWPSNGVFPTKLFNKNYAWSISVNAAKYGKPDINKVKVTLKHLNSGEVWTFSNETQSSTASNETYFNVNTGGYGVSNCIIFRPKTDSNFKYKEGDVYQVTVSGLEKELSYIVKMFDIE